MSGPPPDPFQPIINAIADAKCALLKAIQSQQLTPGPTVVNVLPPRSDKASVGHFVVTTTPMRIRPANPNRNSISIVNGGSASIFIGTDKSVSDSTHDNPGYEILAQSTFDDDAYTGEIWGVVATGTVTITYWEE